MERRPHSDPAVVSGLVITRQVDRNGCVATYHRRHYIGPAYTGQTLWVSLDPTGPTWVFADAAGNELRTHLATELTAEQICGLLVTYRQGKDS